MYLARYGSRDGAIVQAAVRMLGPLPARSLAEPLVAWPEVDLAVRLSHGERGFERLVILVAPGEHEGALADIAGRWLRDGQGTVEELDDRQAHDAALEDFPRERF